MERLIQWHVTSNINELPLPGLHAYTVGRLTETALSTVVNAMEKMVRRGKLLLMVSLDCSSAFDNIKYTSARSALEESGVEQNIIEWYEEILRSRKITAELQGEKKVYSNEGEPTGWGSFSFGLDTYYKLTTASYSRVLSKQWVIQMTSS